MKVFLYILLTAGFFLMVSESHTIMPNLIGMAAFSFSAWRLGFMSLPWKD